MRKLRVGIVGQGTAGSAAALFLGAAGHDVTIYERVAEPGPVGAGIILQPTGMAVLERLGLFAEVSARGDALAGLVVRTPSGRRVIELSYAALGRTAFGLGIHRGALHETLAGALAQRPITLCAGRAARAVTIESANQTAFIDFESSEREGPFDLVVVADGSRSVVAASVFPKRRQTTYPWGALWFVGEDPGGRVHARLEQVVEGTERMIGLLPTGLGPREGATGKRLVSLYYSVRSDRAPEVRADLKAFRAEAARLMPKALPVLDQIQSSDELLFTTYQDVRLGAWHTGPVVVIGDAGHAMSPQLGQGANLALFDAMVLGDTLEAADDVREALADYSAARRAHLAWFAWATRRLTPFFQSDGRLLGLLRDAGMPLLSVLPPFERWMTASMGGVMRGPLRQDLSLMPGSIRL